MHPTDSNRQSIDYAALQPLPKNDRWSPLAVMIYVITCCVVIVFFAELTINPLPAAPLIFLFITGSIAVVGSCMMFQRRRGTIPRIDNLWPFAEANNLSIISAQPSSNLSSQVRIRLSLATILKSYIPWYFDILLSLHGTYKNYPVSFYSLSMATGTPSDSTIEQDAENASYAQPSDRATITLTMWAGAGFGPSVRPGCGVVVWEIPDISSNNAKQIYRKLWRYNNATDLQSDGTKIAILLDANIPYDRKGMMKLFQLLDHIDEGIRQSSISAR